jgi:hypothetical protein
MRYTPLIFAGQGNATGGRESMRAAATAFGIFALVLTAGIVTVPDSAHARRCKTITTSHNGTEIFNGPGGAAIVATSKLMAYAEELRIAHKARRVRVGKVRTWCGDWFMKYLLPHRNCKARATVCIYR